MSAAEPHGEQTGSDRLDVQISRRFQAARERRSCMETTDSREWNRYPPSVRRFNSYLQNVAGMWLKYGAKPPI